MFKNYYSILGISYPSNNEEIRQAYNDKVEKLGEDSAKETNPYYAERVDVEEAFRIIGASYGFKTAYDDEYAQYLESEDKDNFSIQNDWTISVISSERAFVINRILPNTSINQKQCEKKHFGSKMLGCFMKILCFLFFMLTIAYVKTCARKQARNSFVDSYTVTNYNSDNSISNTSNNFNAEYSLQKAVGEINNSLPCVVDNNITHNYIYLTSTALVYVYLVEDDYFDMMKEQALSPVNQLSKIRAMYTGMKPMIDLLVQTHRGISYKYVCKNSKETNIVEVPYEDLASL